MKNKSSRTYWILWKKCWVKGRNKPFMTIEAGSLTNEAKNVLGVTYYSRLLKYAATYKKKGLIKTEEDFNNFPKMKWVELKPGMSGYKEIDAWKSGMSVANTDWSDFNPIEGAYEIG